jgi:prepilin-type processing-associated H-X9-DG protein
MYAHDNKGFWPMAQHRWNGQAGQPPGAPAAVRDKRWHDYVAKYVMGPQSVIQPGTGTVFSDTQMNYNGTAGGVTGINQEFGTIYDPIHIGTVKDRNNVLWGCPAWKRYTDGSSAVFAPAWNGYAQSYYPSAPKDEPVSTSTADGAFFSKRALRNESSDTTPRPAGARPGNYFKQAQYTRSAERALVVESNASILQLQFSLLGAWIYQPESTTVWPERPHAINMSIDFNRHGKRDVGNGPNDPSLNMLYCDGHAATVSCREAYRAIRFH